MKIKNSLKLIKQAGFTLVELLIVMAIIGILTAILMTSLVKGTQQKKAATETVALLSDIVSIEYDYLDTQGLADGTFIAQGKLCEASQDGAKQLNAFCDGTDVVPPIGTSDDIDISTSDNTEFDIKITNQPTVVLNSIVQAFPVECAQASGPLPKNATEVTCKFDQTSNNDSST